MAAAALGSVMLPKSAWPSLVVVGAACAILPDVDAVGRLTGGGDLTMFGGHRGFTHSVLFALLIAVAITAAIPTRARWSRARVFAYIALATLSHGILDAFTDFGSDIGVAFLSPFMPVRFQAPWQPIEGLFSELFYCLIPLLSLARIAAHVRELPWGSPRVQAPVTLKPGAPDGNRAVRPRRH